MTRRKFYHISMANGEQYFTDKDILFIGNPDLRFWQFPTFQRGYYYVTKEDQSKGKGTVVMRPKGEVWLNKAHIVSVESVGYVEVEE